MIYNNLIYFLVVILILATNSAPDQPQFSFDLALVLFLLKSAAYSWLLKTIFPRQKISNASHYAAAERQGSILAILFFSADVYLFDCQYYFSFLPFADQLPVVASLAGLLLFAAYLAIMWSTARPAYQQVFQRPLSRGRFISTNLKANLPIVLPWLLLSLLADLLQLSSLPLVKNVLSSAWGEPLIFLAFFCCLAIFFPVLITRLWGCTPLPAGPLRSRLESFCRAERVNYADIMLWPLLEGQALTAGVMGLVARYRYLLVTPALLAALSQEELEAVMAHEIGHVKKNHLQLYLFLFLGFSLVAQLTTYPLLYLLTDSDLFYKIIHLTNKKPGNALAFASTVPMFLLMIVYFRYVIGFFMRNFERQADLYALKTMGDSAPLIQVFEKIAWLSGNSRNLPSWHHFGIGQRIDFLRLSGRNPTMIARHDRKIHTVLACYLATMIIAALALWQTPDNLLERAAPREKFAEAVIRQKISEEPANYVWQQLLGDLQYSRKHYHDAITAYRQALALFPELPEVYNNLAWLLLTVEVPGLHDPSEALRLAKKAVVIQPSPHILDTLALAYWQNGFTGQALLAEQRAIEQNPPNLKYYQEQLQRFRSSVPAARAGQEP